MTSWKKRGLLAALLSVSAASSLGAQGRGTVSILPLQPLTFGLLIPGVAESVPVTDVSRRAVVALSGTGAFDVSMLLPTALETADGARIPLRFSDSGAGLLSSPSAPVQVLNPHDQNRVLLHPDRTAHLLLGGIALPANGQAPGRYSARVLVIISQPGT